MYFEYTNNLLYSYADVGTKRKEDKNIVKCVNLNDSNNKTTEVQPECYY